MGFGNGLCVDKRIYDEFEPYLKEACKEYDKGDLPEDHPAVIYNSWETAIINMDIIDDKYLEEYKPNK